MKNNKQIIILDYGVGNVKSLLFTLKKISTQVKVSGSINEIRK